MSKCLLFHNWGDWGLKEFTVYPEPNPLQSYTFTSYSGSSNTMPDLFKPKKVSMNERKCKRCGLTKTSRL